MYLNTLENVAQFRSAFERGQWPTLLSMLAENGPWEPDSPQELALFDTYELMVQELAILKEWNLMEITLKSFPIFDRMKAKVPERYFALQQLSVLGGTEISAKSNVKNNLDLWGGQSLEQRRKAVADRK